MKLGKKKEAYIPKTGLLGTGKDYAVYRVKLRERVLCLLVGLAAGAVVGWVFYEHLVAVILFALICAAVSVPIWKNNRIRRQQDKLLAQFLSMLESLSTSLGAGSNVYDAFFAASDDMKTRYGADSFIAREMDIINNGVLNGLTHEALLKDMGERSCQDDIIDFANVFETCNAVGGNIREVIKNTYRVLNDKISIKLDIKTMVASQKTEQNAMLVMPVLFVALLKKMGSDTIDLSSPTGRITTTVAIALFVVSYFLGKKILDIKA